MLYSNKSCLYHGERVPLIRVAFYSDHILLNENVDHEGTRGASFCMLCLRTYAIQLCNEDAFVRWGPYIIPQGSTGPTRGEGIQGCAGPYPEPLRRRAAYEFLGCHGVSGVSDYNETD